MLPFYHVNIAVSGEGRTTTNQSVKINLHAKLYELYNNCIVLFYWHIMTCEFLYINYYIIVVRGTYKRYSYKKKNFFQKQMEQQEENFDVPQFRIKRHCTWMIL